MVKSVFIGSPHFNMKKFFGSPDPNIFLSAIAIFSCIRGLLEQNGVSRDLYVDFCLAVFVPMVLKSFDLQDGEKYLTTFGKRYRHVYKYWQIKPLSTPQLLFNYILFYKILKKYSDVPFILWSQLKIKLVTRTSTYNVENKIFRLDPPYKIVWRLQI